MALMASQLCLGLLVLATPSTAVPQDLASYLVEDTHDCIGSLCCLSVLSSLVAGGGSNFTSHLIMLQMR